MEKVSEGLHTYANKADAQGVGFLGLFGLDGDNYVVNQLRHSVAIVEQRLAHTAKMRAKVGVALSL